MCRKCFILICLLYPLKKINAQVISFGSEIKVNITGLTFDAMEPFISNDGNTLFFNSLNSGGNTNLHYASRINDSIFNYEGLLGGCYDTSSNHLDAVASLDSVNRFFWVSLRGYPSQLDNLHTGLFNSNNISNINRVHGDFNIPVFGWLIMDAAINTLGDQLYYCNAYFDFANNSCGAGVPCASRLGVALKDNDSTFNKLINSDAILSNVNDTNYLVYAPQISSNGLELYYTRLLKTSINTEICVTTRSNVTDTFGIPSVLYSNPGYVPEAATISTDMQKIYYHQKDGSNIFKIYLRYRSQSTQINGEKNCYKSIHLFPNPTNSYLKINACNDADNYIIMDQFLQVVVTGNIVGAELSVSKLSAGVYYLQFFKNDLILGTSKFIKQ